MKTQNKVQEASGSVIYFKKYFFQQWWLFLLGISCLVFSLGGMIALPFYFGRITTAMKDDDWDEINNIVYTLAIIVAISSVATLIRAGSFNMMSHRVGKELRRDLFNSISTKDVSFFDKNKSGDLVSRLSSDTTVIEDGISTNISMLLTSIL